jgi:tetraacyldisaccharide 4'-kinase
VTRILMPLNPLYAAAVAAKNFAYDHAWLRLRMLRWPVVSIGNISIGGSGKTPLVIRLAELLTAEGIAVDVLTRGYGRSGTATELVDPAGDADRYGDEPILIAQRTGVPVWVGASRYVSGRLAEEGLIPGVKAIHLLDDGFQHRKLARSVDIVVVRASDLDERLLPAGRLRESLGAMRRASILALRAEENSVEAELRRRGVGAPVWWLDRRLEIEPMERAVAFCGIANPEEFMASLRGVGVEVIKRSVYRDHHRFSKADIEQIVARARDSKARAFVTTEKDAVRLTPEMRAVMERVAPLRVARLIVNLRDEQTVVRDLLQRVAGGTELQSAIKPIQYEKI